MIITTGVICFLSSMLLAEDKGSVTVKTGYTYIDHDGSLGLNQETYNQYEGVGLSLLDIRYNFDNGVYLNGDLANFTLNNRNLKMGIGKAGLFSLSVTNNQYRRVYDFDGNNFTRRNNTGVQFSINPHKLIKLYGGYGLTKKHGTSFEIFSPISDTVIGSTDYQNTTYNVGSLIGNRKGSVRLDYRHYKFDDKTLADVDRTADKFSATASILVPRYEWMVVSGGYIYRQDKADITTSKLETNQLWGATKLYIPKLFVLDYRLLYGYAKHTGPKRETDHIDHTASISKNWPKYGGLRVGFEYRIDDDFVNKSNSSGILANGWLKPTYNLYFNAMLATRKTTVDEGVTLMGDEDVIRHQVGAKYSDTTWGDIMVQWQGRNRTNDDINSKVNYNTISTQLNLVNKTYGRMNVTWTYYEGKYENRSDAVGFEFADHVLCGNIYLPTWKNFSFDFGATYYRTGWSTDIEKSNLNFGLTYTFVKDHHLEVRYNLFNYDDYLLNNNYYTANIVEINIIKELGF
jgi:hypothetical protein